VHPLAPAPGRHPKTLNETGRSGLGDSCENPGRVQNAAVTPYLQETTCCPGLGVDSMVDFDHLRKAKAKAPAISPREIFTRLPKPAGINDLYASQAEVLDQWFERHTEKDLVLKLPTGGGKTLVGLLIGQSALNEGHGPVAYFANWSSRL
jgi:hypothetical protein